MHRLRSIFLSAGFLFLCALVFSAPPANAKKVANAKKGYFALVIGNADYRTAPFLLNPVNDARAIRKALGKIGFQVVYGENLTRAQTHQKIGEFFSYSSTMKVAAVFYAGHGIQIDGVNYIIPVDADFEKEADLNNNVVSMSDLIRYLDKQSDVGLVFLDACRDNPFRSQIQSGLSQGLLTVSRSMGRIELGGRGLERLANNTGPDEILPRPPQIYQSRTTGTGASLPVTIGAGLAEIDAGVGMLVAFATRPGQVALDGAADRRHSPFTEGLLKYMTKPGLEIRQMLTRVRNHVRGNTSGKQIPWDSSSLIKDLYLVAALPPKKAKSVRRKRNPQPVYRAPPRRKRAPILP